MEAPTTALRQCMAGKLVVRSHASRADMARAAAGDIAAAMRRLIAAKGAIRMVFAAAPSQAEMLAALVATSGIDWARVTAFQMDEYVGLDAAAPQRFANWLDAHLFGRAPFGAVHLMAPEPDTAQAARDYAALLAAAPVDIVCLGIGVNGHIAFNDPPVADFQDPADVKTVSLDEICRQQQVDDGCFATRGDVPTHALTLTIPRLLRAEQLFCTVPGPLKRAAVAQTLHGPVTTGCPSSILREHACCSLYLDADSDPDA